MILTSHHPFGRERMRWLTELICKAYRSCVRLLYVGPGHPIQSVTAAALDVAELQMILPVHSVIVRIS